MSTYTGNGQFDLETLSLFYNVGGDNETELNLKSAYVQLDLYESVFSNTMSGSLSIIDSFNLQDILPLYGNERIEMSFFTSGNKSNPIVYTGVVYKVSEKHRISEHSSGYTIHFISKEAINSINSNVQRSYNAISSDVAKFLYDRVKYNKQLNIENTVNIEHYVFGSFKPLQAMNIVCKRSQSKNNEVGYLFYEDNKEFNFVPLQSLYSSESIYEYTSKPKGMHKDTKNRVQDAHKNIQQIKILEENSYMDRMIEGLHGASFYRLDLLNKEYTVFNYDKEKFFDSSKSLGKYAYKKELDTVYENKFSMRYDNGSTLPLDVIAKSLQSKIEISTIRAEMSIFGNSILRCGKCIDLTLPNWNKDQDEVNDKISGKFLMGDIHHQLVKDNQYSQTIMLYKDAYEEL